MGEKFYKTLDNLKSSSFDLGSSNSNSNKYEIISLNDFFFLMKIRFKLKNLAFRSFIKEKGFGLFALRQLTPGTLLLVDKPFVFVQPKSNEDLFDSNPKSILFSITQKVELRFKTDSNLVSGKYLRQSALELLWQLERKLLIEPEASIEKLSDLIPFRQLNQREINEDDDNYQLISYRNFLELYERNVFGNGLWPKLSRFNHSCLPNCFFLFINNLCFVNVLKSIDIGEELTISYLPSNYLSYLDRTLYLREFYIEECRCSLCCYDRDHGQAEMQQLYRQFEEGEDDEEKRRYIFKRLISQYGPSRPLGFVEQMAKLQRPVTIEILSRQVRHGYLAHRFLLNYLSSNMHKYEKLKEIHALLRHQFAYFDWNLNDSTSSIEDHKEKWKKIIDLLIQVLPA